MGRVAPARLVALDAVVERRRRGARMRDLLRAAPEMSRLTPRDRALSSRLALGVTATRGALDLMIDSHLSGGRHLEPRVRDALRVATYELCWLGTPAAVAVSQGVELVRSVSPRAAGLANAVLHHVASQDAMAVDAAIERVGSGRTDLFAPDAALASGMPEWLVYQLLASCGTHACREVVLAQLEPAPVYVAGNPALMSADETLRRMRDAGLEPVPTELPASWSLASPARLASSGLVGNAVVFPADLAAQVVARIAAPRAGQRMLEIGQGRGTKTALLQSAALADGGFADVVAIDSQEGKVRLAASRMAVAGMSGHVTSLAYDGCALDQPGLPAPLASGFDVVFIDAPCSGTGTMRRHPEIVWGLERGAVALGRPDSLPVLQLQMLRSASARVRLGGALVYATCSLLSQEDEEVVSEFLEGPEGERFELVSALEAPGILALDEEARAFVAQNVDHDGTFVTHPRPGGYDGHFCARMIRVS